MTEDVFTARNHSWWRKDNPPSVTFQTVLAGSIPVWLSAVRHASRRQYDVFPVVACRRRRQNQLQRHNSLPSHYHLQPKRV